MVTTSGKEDEVVLLDLEAKLYSLDKEGNQWKERGTGTVKLLKHMDSGKVRLLMVKFNPLKICAHHTVLPSIQFRYCFAGNEKSCEWRAADCSDGEMMDETFSIRFASAQNCRLFRDKVEEVVDSREKLILGGDDQEKKTEAVITGKEEEVVLLDLEAKLYSLDKEGNQWNERGTGTVKLLKHMKSGKVRLLMKSKPLKICAYHNVLPSIKFRYCFSGNEKSCEWHAADCSDAEMKEETFSIRFASAENCRLFRDKVEEVAESQLKLIVGGDQQEKKTEAKESFTPKTKIPVVVIDLEDDQEKKPVAKESFTPTKNPVVIDLADDSPSSNLTNSVESQWSDPYFCLTQNWLRLLNTCTPKELKDLPGIGKQRSKLIVDNRPFKKVDEVAELFSDDQVKFGRVKEMLKMWVTKSVLS